MRSLFNRWRTPRDEGGPLYSVLVAEARRPAWYVEGGVADTLDGRFAVLASLVALAILRLEEGGEGVAVARDASEHVQVERDMRGRERRADDMGAHRSAVEQHEPPAAEGQGVRGRDLAARDALLHQDLLQRRGRAPEQQRQRRQFGHRARSVV